MAEQLNLFDINPEHAITWTPRELWLRLQGSNVGDFVEDRRLERKSGKRVDFDRYAEYLSMWSNTVDGGILLFGVEDDGTVSGCNSLGSSIINRLGSHHSRACPDATPEVREIGVVVNGKSDFVVAIFVPYRGFLVETDRSEAFIRRGDTKHRLSAEEKDDFRSTRHERSWEQRPSHAFRWPDDFDRKVISEFCENFRVRERKDRWSDQEILMDRHLLIEEERKIVPLNCLTLFAAKDPRLQHPGCRIRFQRFEGIEEKSGVAFRPLKDFYVEGNIPSLIRKASDAIEDLIYNVTWLNRDGKFVTTPEYPRWAWFEAIVNALVHRSYSFSGSEVTVKFFSDRLEIESPGGFVPPVNADNVYHVRASRNLHLMEALRYVGFVQMSREGTRRMRESMEGYNLPAPSFSQETLHGVSVKVTLRNEHLNRKRATDRDVATYLGVDRWRELAEHEVQIVGYAYNNGAIQVAEAARLTSRTWNTAKRDLERLVRKGVLQFVPGQMPRDPKAHYIVAPPMDQYSDVLG